MCHASIRNKITDDISSEILPPLYDPHLPDGRDVTVRRRKENKHRTLGSGIRYVSSTYT